MEMYRGFVGASGDVRALKASYDEIARSFRNLQERRHWIDPN
jgi:hypothetical protein